MILKNVALMLVISAINKPREGRSFSTFSYFLNVLILLFSLNCKLNTQPTISAVLVPSPFPQLCHSECVDVEFVIENGSGNYNISIQYIGPPFTINNFQEGEVFHICNGGPEYPAYIYDDATRTLFTGNPPNNSSLNIDITIVDFYDLVLGQGSIGNPYYVFEIHQNIQPIQISPQIICTSQYPGEIDLTSLEPDIIPSDFPGYNISVLWFEDAALTIPISNPASFITSSTTVYATLSFFWNGPPYHVCTSEAIPIELIVAQLPEIDIPAPFEDCHDFILPPITGQNISTNAAYFTMPNSGGITYHVGDVIANDITLYIQDGISGCEGEVSFDIDILPRLYMEPQDVVSAC
ncbi:MAG: hypothetical protein WAU36_12625, partial [Cyclobacteriaceae bacterium]